jgi:hypothetical protein
MVHREIASLEDICKISREFNSDPRWKFRGQSNVEWDLRPTIARDGRKAAKEQDNFNYWKGVAVSMLPKEPPNDWEWLAVAQHHGLATRLLDWTFHILTAAFFAACAYEHHAEDGVVYALFEDALEKELEKERRPLKRDDGPFKSPGIRIVHPPLITPRVGAQASLFTIHGEPEEGDADGELYECLKRYVGRKGLDHHLYQIIIRADYKERLLFDLSQFGVNWLSLFPDLWGLSRYVEWSAQNPNGPPT